MMPGDRLVCAFVQRQEAGHEFARWPLHITIVPWFRAQEDSGTISAGLERALSSVRPFKVRAVERAMFGPHRSRPVVLIGTPTPLEDIEHKVRTYLHKKRAWLVDETTKRKFAFRPHITEQGTQSLHVGDTVHVDRLYVVEQKGGHKVITHEIVLGNG